MIPSQSTRTSVLRITLALALALMFHHRVMAQTGPGDVRVEIDMMPSLTQAQTLSLTTLGVDTQGAGNRVMNLINENTTGRNLTDLYLYVNVSASGIGTLTQLDQRQGRPFSLNPGQVVVASNNDLQDGLPGVSESIRMTGELTSAGEDFINQLEGSTTLPDRVYSVELQIFHGSNRLSGGNLIAETSVALPKDEMFTDMGFDLDSPGNVIGAPLERITSTRPVFRWQGNATQTYRILIVKSVEGQSAQGLIQAGLDTEPVLGASVTGDLLEFEMADILVTGNSFNYPLTRAQPLEPGTRLFWQVFAQLNTPTGTVQHPSPVWQFGIQRTDAVTSELDEEILGQISRFLPDMYMDILLDGYTIEEVEINGQTMSGPQLLMEMEQFVNDLENGTILIIE